MQKTLVKKLYEHYTRATTKREDAPVLNFIESLPSKDLHYLEVASGLGRFPLLIQKLFPSLTIQCIEINKNLTEHTVKSGIPTLVGSILEVDLGEEQYDIVHCSHIIEHFGYPHITHVLDTILRTTKTGGYIIIRTPLLYPGFYKEIDHIRPYPPESIFNYLNNPQQQKIGTHSVREVSRWYRRDPAHIETFEGRLMFYINLVFKLLWVYIRFPFSRRTGYVLILQKV